MAVREARVSDAAEIAAMVREHAAHEGALERCSFDERAARAALFCDAPTLRALIASSEEDPDVPAGCMLWYPTYSSWAALPGAWVEDLYVRPAYRRSGLGRQLLDALRAMVEGRVEWDVHVTNDAATQFYRRLGAVPVTEWTKYRWER